MAVFTTTTILLFLIVKIVKTEFWPWHNTFWVMPILLYFIYTMIFIPDNIAETLFLYEWTTTIGLTLFSILFLTGFITVWYRNQRTDPTNKAS